MSRVIIQLLFNYGGHYYLHANLFIYLFISSQSYAAVIEFQCVAVYISKARAADLGVLLLGCSSS